MNKLSRSIIALLLLAGFATVTMPLAPVVAELRAVVEPGVSQFVMPAPVGTNDYTATLVQALARRSAAGDPKDLVFQPGEYHFYGPLPTDDVEELWDNFSWSTTGPSAPTRQHRVQGDSNDHRYRVQFILHMDNETDIWCKMIRDYRFGPISITGNIAFRIASDGKGSVFSFGDPEEPGPHADTMRGLKLEIDYDRDYTHYGSNDVGDGGKWLTDLGSTHGWVLDKTNQSFGLRMFYCYDVELDINARGFKYAVINHNCDRPRGSILALSCGRALLETGQTGVSAAWENVWEENPIIGSCINGHIIDFRGETNSGNYATSPGVYALPSTVNWEIEIGSDTIDFSSWDGSYRCQDYFEPWTVIRLDPSQTGEPDRWLLITDVTDNSVSFYNSTAQSYQPREISGTGAACYRYFGIPGTTYGGRFDIVSRASVSNISTLPFFAAAPGSSPARLGSNVCGRGNEPNSPQWTQIIADCAGVAEGVYGGIDMIGTSDMPPHPLVNTAYTPKLRYDRRTRNAHWNPATKTVTAYAGYGVSAINNNARKLTFHPLTDPYGIQVYGYRPGDDATIGWSVRDAHISANKLTDVEVVTYTAAGATVYAYGGAGGFETDTVAAGWDVAVLQLDAAQMVVDGEGFAFVQLGGTDYYATEVRIKQ